MTPLSNQIRDAADQPAMADPESEAEVAEIIAAASLLPLPDAAYALWRRRYRLDALEGRPSPEEIRINRALPPDQFAAKLRWQREHAEDGPAFTWMKRAHRHACDDAIRRAIADAVQFEGACFRYFEQGAGDYWLRCEHAVARARKDFPGFGEGTYQAAANDVAYYYK